MPPTFPDYTVPQPDLAATTAQYDDFHTRLAAATSAADCLAIVADWDAVLCQFNEWGSLTYIRFQQDTQNEAYIAAKDELDAIKPKYDDLATKLKQALLDSPFRSEMEETLSPTLFAKWECNTKSFDTIIEDDSAAEAKLQSEYTALTAGAEIEFNGETLTISELHKFADDADRRLREGGCRAQSQWFIENAPELDRIYDEQVALRQSMAVKLGYETFTELGYERMTRIGYGPDEVTAFRNEVRDKVVPLAMEVASKQEETLGVDKLMYWDRNAYTRDGNPKPQGDHDWMVDRATEMFDEMGAGLDSFFGEMKARGTMDLKSRKGKAGGGFCDYLHQFEFPFIFGNFNGTRGDVDVFTHEVGHAFQSYQSRHQPMSEIVWPTTEACEIHSMALEFLTWPHMEKFYGEEAAEELRRVHLSAYLQFLPYGVSIDHFQHLVYANPEATPEERNEMWQEIERTYLPHWDYGDLPAESSGRLWQQKAHVYQCPFYYIDYCLALTGALQFWTKSRTDAEGTLETYAELCTRGGSLDYTGLLQSAGLRSPFEAGCLDEVLADAKRYLT
ncbi:MAG: M3 family oligoendopeptidase [Verrucomicrobiales bacterium]|nr:M3 family oligoendopeptidase [Verrucomicrobiales bacterium]